MKIGVVVVTYNRLDKLKTSLSSYDQQSYLPEYVLVIDNHSTDGTTEYLDNWKEESGDYHKYVVHMDENTGGSGGFAVGLEKSLDLGADWVWVADDDAYASQTALEIAQSFLLQHSQENIAAICGTVMSHGVIDYGHRRHIDKKLIRISEPISTDEEYQKPFFEIDLFSYVGSLINTDAMRKVGITNKDFFIWYDDTEHSMRLRKYGKIYCVPAITVEHDTPMGNTNTQELSWKNYYGIRNCLYAYKQNMPYLNYLYMRSVYIRQFNAAKDNHDDVRATLIKEAMKDCRQNHLGKHALYVPGWK